MNNKETQQKLINNLMVKVNEFPTLPTIYSKLSDTINNPTSSAADVAEVISQDQAAVTKILKVANSSVYGFVRKVTSIDQAVVYIGFQQIKALVLALSVIKLFDNTKEIKNLTPDGLWRYSFAVGAIYHTGFVDGRFQLMSSIIHISIITASMLDLGDSGMKKVPMLHKEVWKHISLPDDFFTKNYQIFYNDYQEMSSLLLSK